MKKLHALALCAVFTPVIALGAGSALADDDTNQNLDQDQQTIQIDKDATHTITGTIQLDESTQGAELSGSQTGAAGTSASQSDGTGLTDSQSGGTGMTGSQSDETGLTDSQTGANVGTRSDQYRMQNRGFMESAPSNGMQASELIGATVRSSADENVGSVEDLLLDENGQVMAIIVSVGGFLGMGQTDVAIGWDDVSRSGDANDPDLRIDVTGDHLRDAPAFVRLD